MDEEAIKKLLADSEARTETAFKSALDGAYAKFDAERAKVGRDWRAKIKAGGDDALSFYRHSCIVVAVVFAGAGTMLTYAVLKFWHPAG